MRRIKHQPSPLGLRVHPSILLLPLNRASRCVPSRRSSPCLARRMAGGFPALGTRDPLLAASPATRHRSRCESQHIAGRQSSPGVLDPGATLRQRGCSYICEAEPAPHPMQLMAWGEAASQGLPPAPAPPEQVGPSSPCSRRNSLVSTLLFPSKTGGKWGLLGPPAQRHDQGKPFGWVSRWCFQEKCRIFIPVWNQSSRRGTWSQRSLKK